MKFNPVVVRAIMQTQFDELKRVRGTAFSEMDQHYPFQPSEVDQIFFSRPGAGRGVWFRLKDGRDFDVRGQPAQPVEMTEESESTTIPPALQELVESVDVVDRLPLAMIPLSSATLRAARLVKNVRLDTMIELHTDRKSGSLQIRPQDVRESFPRFPDDQKVIQKLSELHSFDVYSLRAGLRRLGVHVDAGSLELSENMKNRLDRYTPEFTLPLVRAVFGDDGADVQDRQGLIRMFRDPDRARVTQRLKALSQKTGIPVENIPAFLEHYADTFLSVAYYQHNFETVTPALTRCVLWLRDAQAFAKGTPVCKKVEESLSFLIATIRERLTMFRSSFSLFWGDMSAASFERLKGDIEGRHVGLGAMLCGLSVKMRHWSDTFQTQYSGGPTTRVQYLMSEMEPGLQRLCEFSAQA